MLAEVVVKLKDRRKDIPLTYLIAKNLEKKIKPGSIVEAPLGRRTVPGYVLETKDEALAPAGISLKTIKTLIWQNKSGSIQVELVKKIRDYYGCFLFEALEAVLPAYVLTSSSGEKTPRDLILVNEEKALEFLEKYSRRSPRQAEILEFLLAGEGKIPEAKIKTTGFAATSLKELLAKKLVKFEKAVLPKAPPLPPNPKTKPPQELLPPTKIILNAIKSQKTEAFFHFFYLL